MDFNAIVPNAPATWTNNRLHFFKYMSESTAKKVLENRTLRWSTAATLNDPFELQLQVSIDSIDIENVKREALTNIWRLYSGNVPIPAANPLGVMLEILRIYSPGLSKEELFQELGDGIGESLEVIKNNTPKNREEVMGVLSSIKILSLTIAPDIGLMWSHYANSHRGVVMRFRSIPAFDSPFGMARPIKYSGVRPSFFTESYLINSLSGLQSVNVKEINDAVIYTKMAEWEYEKEWRISSGSGRNKEEPFEDVPFGYNELDGLIFGLRTSKEDRQEITKLAAAYPNIEFMEAIPNQVAGRVDVERIQTQPNAATAVCQFGSS
ncbi:MAG: DUF2971 domain-containing protein [Mesorhizobium sp.]|nr:DUF2971 domain-containing protein [Mesorhizobium sp.]RUV66742.1 DUF2971 domain-containing protein [Mesorhizobium sp. M5C.F.Cr.IN.023.01.1.1]RWI41555.1 MAG: DUF2971 domain-containing protein [Mesorhizobium sp.]RWI46026.1 MAG: DUF2971 domain-containing protein [Mesorhizobium sp.]RWJ01485.1 MAG: DUF2971 domain-containing protein [Mesorhizobium sp.]RWJ09337.1 MAG: DUF2971 domain-containing protein [Mesorhizobium sp.]